MSVFDMKDAFTGGLKNSSSRLATSLYEHTKLLYNHCKDT